MLVTRTVEGVNRTALGTSRTPPEEPGKPLQNHPNRSPEAPDHRNSVAESVFRTDPGGWAPPGGPCGVIALCQRWSTAVCLTWTICGCLTGAPGVSRGSGEALGGLSSGPGKPPGPYENHKCRPKLDHVSLFPQQSEWPALLEHCGTQAFRSQPIDSPSAPAPTSGGLHQSPYRGPKVRIRKQQNLAYGIVDSTCKSRVVSPPEVIPSVPIIVSDLTLILLICCLDRI